MAEIEFKKIIIVDDDDTFRNRLMRALEDRSFKVLGCKTAKEAREGFSLFLPQYAIIDLRIKEESGIILLRYLLSVKKDLQALILTGYGSISTTVEAIKIGAVNYLTKPVDAKKIIEVLINNKHINNKRELENTPSLSQVEWDYIQRVVVDCEGNISKAAQTLGIHRRSLQRKLAKNPGRCV